MEKGGLDLYQVLKMIFPSCPLFGKVSHTNKFGASLEMFVFFFYWCVFSV